MDTDEPRAATKSTNGAAKEPAGNGDIEANRDPVATECDKLLSVQVGNGNGETVPSRAAAPPPINHGSDYASRPVSAVCKIKEDLNEVVCCKLRLWMIIILILVLLSFVVVASLFLCTVIHEDVDDKYDSTLFKIPRHFNGSFQMPNMDFTEDLRNLSFNESENVKAELQKELANIYSSSVALGRYFSKAEIFAFRNGSVITDYQLTFLLPEEEQESIRTDIVSREMVYNVLRQFLYDQEEEEAIFYIKPSSLTMFVQDG